MNSAREPEKDQRGKDRPDHKCCGSDKEHEAKSDDRNTNDGCTNKKTDNTHDHIHEHVAEVCTRILDETNLVLLESLEGREHMRNHLRDSKKVVDEPDIVPPDIHNIRVGNTVVPNKIIPNQR